MANYFLVDFPPNFRQNDGHQQSNDLDFEDLRVLLSFGQTLTLATTVNLRDLMVFFRPNVRPKNCLKERCFLCLVSPKQRMTLFARAAMVNILVRRLMLTRCTNQIRAPFHHSACIARRWLAPITLNPRNLENLRYLQNAIFQEGVDLCRRECYFVASIRFRDASMLHHPPSNVTLADMCISGRVEWGRTPIYVHNSKRAFELAFSGALTRCMDSLGILAYCYLSGEGTVRSPEIGLALALRSSNADSFYGKFALGLCYKEGWGVFRDFAEAVRLFHLAAAHDHSLAQYNLGIMYENGLGVPKDTQKAFDWYEKASDQGLKEAWNRTIDMKMS